MKYESILETIGNTPLVHLNKIEKLINSKANIYAKVESFNPSGSVKDRASYQMIKDALDEGLIDKDTVIIEQTSGNTGIGLCMIGAYLGLKVIIVMPSSMSQERIKMMKIYGAEVVLSDGKLGMQGSVDLVQELKEKYPNHFIPYQFDNLSNSKAHYLTTGPEIYHELEGKVDIFIAGIGTGGTISGIGSYLKEQNKDIKVYGVEPFESNILNGGKASGHIIQGIGANFIPSVLNKDIYDGIIDVKGEDAKEWMHKLVQNEGIFSGISSGASLKAAIDLAVLEENKGKNIVIVLPDSMNRYLSILEV